MNDAVAVDIAREGTHGVLTLLIECGHNLEERDLDRSLVDTIRTRLRERCSPRHVPDQIFGITTLPRTISGKKLEVPVKRILLGETPERALSRGSLADPSAVDAVIAIRELANRPHS
jgi:acetoacetyl-CoA synthetase